jgi:hypothetical protein
MQRTAPQAAAAGRGIADANSPFSTLLSSLRAPTPKGASLLSDSGPMTPVVVYTGPTRTPEEIARLATIQPASHHKKKGSKTAAAKPTDETPSDDKAADGKAGEGKASGEKGKTKAHWTPTSSSSLAGSPPPELETKSSGDKKKKKHAATAKTEKPDPASKPASAQ